MRAKEDFNRHEHFSTNKQYIKIKATFTQDRICSDPFGTRSIWYGSTLFTLDWFETETASSIWDHFHEDPFRTR